jgi:hypothetical protein
MLTAESSDVEVVSGECGMGLGLKLFDSLQDSFPEAGDPLGGFEEGSLHPTESATPSA